MGPRILRWCRPNRLAWTSRVDARSFRFAAVPDRRRGAKRLPSGHGLVVSNIPDDMILNGDCIGFDEVGGQMWNGERLCSGIFIAAPQLAAGNWAYGGTFR